MVKGTLTENALRIIQLKGQPAQMQACRRILENPYDEGPISDALHYYAQSVLPRALPIFPALINLSSKAVGADK